MSRIVIVMPILKFFQISQTIYQRFDKNRNLIFRKMHATSIPCLNDLSYTFWTFLDILRSHPFSPRKRSISDFNNVLMLWQKNCSFVLWVVVIHCILCKNSFVRLISSIGWLFITRFWLLQWFFWFVLRLLPCRFHFLQSNLSRSLYFTVLLGSWSAVKRVLLTHSNIL